MDYRIEGLRNNALRRRFKEALDEALMFFDEGVPIPMAIESILSSVEKENPLCPKCQGTGSERSSTTSFGGGAGGMSPSVRYCPLCKGTGVKTW